MNQSATTPWLSVAYCTARELPQKAFRISHFTAPAQIWFLDCRSMVRYRIQNNNDEDAAFIVHHGRIYRCSNDRHHHHNNNKSKPFSPLATPASLPTPPGRHSTPPEPHSPQSEQGW
jgi:hypothetical protein